jgi:hypothetical protein
LFVGAREEKMHAKVLWRRLNASTILTAVAIIGIGLISSDGISLARGGVERDSAAKRVADAYGKLPLSFEVNRGQTGPAADFVAHGGQYTVLLTRTGAITAFDSSMGHPSSGSVHHPTTSGAAVRMSLVGSNPQPTVAGMDKLPGTANYFIGKEPAQWLTAIPTYGSVKYSGVYPGIEVTYRGTQGKLEYEFMVAPGASVGAIVIEFQGQDQLSLDASGDLVLTTFAGQVHESKPVIYQDMNGGRRAIPGGFILSDANRVAFQVGRYDATRPLVIDPGLAYSTYLGGSALANTQAGNGIAVDVAGNAYVAGNTGAADFPTTPGAFQTTLKSYSDAFISKLNPAGTALLYSTYLGGNGGDGAASIAIDAGGNAYVTGGTGSSDFPTTPGAFQTSPKFTSQAFITKLNPTGTALVYSTYLGGSATCSGRGIAIDAAGNAYVAGVTSAAATDFPTTAGAYQTSPNGFGDAFVTKLNSTGSGLVYSTLLGGTGGGESQDAFGIALDAGSQAHVTGWTNSTAFPTTPGAFQTSLKGSGNAFVTKFNTAGSGLVYSTYLGGSGVIGTRGDFGFGIAVDVAGLAYVTGFTRSTDFPTTPGAFQGSFQGGLGDGFVTKVNLTGTGLLYSTYLGGSGDESGQGIAVDLGGQAYVTGVTSSTNFPTTPGSFQTSYHGNGDAFVTKLNPLGTGLAYSTYLGGSSGDNSQGIALDFGGNVYLTGFTTSTDFPTTPGAFQTSLKGSQDAFVTKFALAPACPEADGNGRMIGKHGGDANLNFDEDQCEDMSDTDTDNDRNPNDDVEFRDTGSGTDFRSVNINSIQFGSNGPRSVTITGTGVNAGHAVTFTVVAVSTTANAPGFFSIVLSDGYQNSGNLSSGVIDVS